MPDDLLAGPPPTRLPVLTDAEALRTGGADPRDVAARYPSSSAAWADLADAALTAGEPVAAYAYARTGYHRGLDQLRRNGWKGHGPVPAAEPGNQGWLRCVGALGRAAASIGEDDEAQRCRDLLADSDPAALAYLSA